MQEHIAHSLFITEDVLGSYFSFLCSHCACFTHDSLSGTPLHKKNALSIIDSVICYAAICLPECGYRGICVQPGICLCEAGWTGTGCIGMYVLMPSTCI